MSESKRQTQPESNTEGEKKEEVEEESKGDDGKKKGKRSMNRTKRKQEYRSINEMMDGPGGKAKGVVIGGRAAANESDAEKPQRKRPAHTAVKSSYSLRSLKIYSEEKKPKGKEKEQETHVLEANQDTDRKGKGIADPSDDESDSSESD